MFLFRFIHIHSTADLNGYCHFERSKILSLKIRLKKKIVRLAIPIKLFSRECKNSSFGHMFIDGAT